MTKKSKLNKDAFDWVKDTSEETEPSPAPKSRELEESKKQPESFSIIPERRLFIKYKKRSGEILSISEITKGRDKIAGHPFVNVSDHENVEEIVLNEGQAGKALNEIYAQYKVDTAGKAPKLILKR